MEFFARHYRDGRPVKVVLAEGRVRSVEPVQAGGESGPADDLPWVAPGLVDLQINGYGGQEFNDIALDVAGVAEITRRVERDGVTAYLPTATTQSFELLQHVMRTVALACREDSTVAARVPGIHLEGPYLSAEDGPRGAHPREHCRPPDWDEFQRLQDAADGRIRLLTLSPEYPDSAAFIGRVVDSGVLVAIGHTSADSDQIRAAVDAGASLSTHLGNGAHAMIRRHPNYLWDQLADDRLTATLIADGHHLPDSVLKTFVRAKSTERCVLVSDITGMAGMPPGRYPDSSLGDIEVLEDGRLVIGGQRQLLAGASLPLSVGIGHIMRTADVDLATAIEMASHRPARLIGVESGDVAVAAAADLILFDFDSSGTVQIKSTIKAGVANSAGPAAGT